VGEMTHREVAEELKALMVRANDGDEGALPKLRKIFDEVPTLARKFMDPANIAERRAVDLYATGDDLLAREAIPRILEQMRSELEGGYSTPLERLLVERVVATWLQVQCYETLYAQNARKMTMVQSDYDQKRMDRAHNRNLSAVRALAQIRKMGPTVQINIAEKQFNTTGRT
jgi:hypothetical protein